MDALILAGGFGTRMYPLTKNIPKALLKIKEKPIIEWIIEKLIKLDKLNNIYILSNDKFYINFLEWQHDSENKDKIKIINNGINEDYKKRGAIGDIKFAIKVINPNDLLIIASDNLFTFDLIGMVKLSDIKKSSSIIIRKIENIELIKKYSCVLINDNGKVINFEEKPKNPKSNLVAIACYLILKEDIEKIKLHNFGEVDNMGNLIEFLHKESNIFSYSPEGEWMDIGSIEGLEQAQKLFGRSS